MHSRRETVRSGKPEHHNVRQRVGSGTECTGASRFENQVGCLQRTNEPTDQPNYQQPTEPSRQNLLFCNTLIFLSCRRLFPPPPPPPPPSSPFQIVCLLKPRRRKRQVHFPGMFFFREKVCEQFLVIAASHTPMSVGLRVSNVASAPVEFTVNGEAITTRQPAESYLDSTTRTQFARGPSLPVQTCATAAESNAEYRRIAAAGRPDEVAVLPSWASPTAVYCALPSETAYFDFRALYTAKPELLKVLRAAPRADPDQTVFDYAGVSFSIFLKERVRLFANSRPRENSTPAFRKTLRE